MPSVSVIMPVYNSAGYLPRSVGSVLNQSFGDFELILINDGSTDESPGLCDRYAASDRRVKVIHQKNSGVSSARNAGIDAAQGEFIAFIDDDDEYLPGLLKENCLLIRKTGADVVKFSVNCCILFPDMAKSKGFKLEKPPGIFSRGDILKQYPVLRSAGCFTLIWDALYRKTLLTGNGIRFDERLAFYEDNAFNYDCLPHIQKIAINQNVYYLYFRRHGDSVSLKYDFRRAGALAVAAGKELDCLKKSGITGFHPRFWETAASIYLNMISVMVFDPRNREGYKKKAEQLRNIRSLEQFRAIEETPVHRIILSSPEYSLFTILNRLRLYRLIKFLCDSDIPMNIIYRMTRFKFSKRFVNFLKNGADSRHPAIPREDLDNMRHGWYP